MPTNTTAPYPVATRRSARRRPAYKSVFFWAKAATLALLAVSLLALLGRWFFLFELFSHFVVQYLLVSAVLVLYWLIRPHYLVLPAIGCFLWHGVQVYPWVSGRQPAAAAPADVRVLHANVLFSRHNYQPIRQLIERENPDVFVLQEMTPAGIQAMQSLATRYPYRVSIWSKGPCYLLVGSKTPFVADQASARQQRVIHIQTRVKGQPVSLITVHPRTPVIPSWFRERNRQLAYVSQLARQQTKPTVLLGDFNVTMWSPVYKDYLDMPELTACRQGFGRQPTWPAFFPPAYLPLDHAFVNSGFQTTRFRTLAVPESDHKALVADLRFAAQRFAAR
ncbi:endonuclease/exonuclease/phosphatase family protein [Nibrella viscosa]|uniref:endonuclease/exonuclease/phosphatase family protein n=1 Tax=Nibrella viscosa TaxID=1084524 RepID=UPI0031E5A762